MWRKVNVVGYNDLEEAVDEHLDRGLDIDAEAMHQRFLADLPHLESAKSNHDEILTHISGKIEHSKKHTRTFDSDSIAFDELDKESAKAGFEINLDIESLTSLTVTTSIDDEKRLVRIIAPERFGGMIRTLSIPAAMDVESAKISDGTLHLSFD
tara:strand:+ start:8666 stop:9127 length:462 start_codon:yes stop_codon:yes gene_type:complete